MCLTARLLACCPIMDEPPPSPVDSLHTFSGVKDAADYLQANGTGTKIRLTGDFKSAARIKQYFYRLGLNTTVKDEPDGSRVVNFNSTSSTGRETRRVHKREYARSKRDPAEPMLHELLEARANQLEVGEQIVVKGRENKISGLLKRRFPEWEFAKSQVNGIWTITRTR